MMQTLEFAIGAGQTQHYQIGGRFLRVIAANDESLSIKFTKLGRVIGEADNVGAFFATDAGTAEKDFDGFIVSSTDAQTVKLAVAAWAVEAL